MYTLKITDENTVVTTSCNMYIVWMGFQHVTATETEGQQDKE